MTEYILLASMALVVVLLLFLRTNTAVCFLALSAGSVLLTASGDNMGLMASSLTSGLSNSVSIVKIALLFAPLVVCAVLLRGQVHKTLLPLAIVPAICTALLSVVFVTPLLSSGTQSQIMATESWSLLMQYQEAFVGIGVVLSLLLVAMTIKKPHDKHKKGHH